MSFVTIEISGSPLYALRPITNARNLDNFFFKPVLTEVIELLIQIVFCQRIMNIYTLPMSGTHLQGENNHQNQNLGQIYPQFCLIFTVWENLVCCIATKKIQNSWKIMENLLLSSSRNLIWLN